MKKLLIVCMIFAGVFAFFSYGDSSGETEQVAIRGFGGYEFGKKLNPKQLNSKMLEKGYVICKAKKVFRKFAKVRLYFTPKTFVIYKISATEKGSFSDMSDIIDTLGKHYKQKMKLGYGAVYSLSRNNKTVEVGRDSDAGMNWIAMTDDNLEKLNAKEKAEIRQSKINDTSGL